MAESNKLSQDVENSQGIGNFFLNMLTGGLFNYVNSIREQDIQQMNEQSADAAFQRSLYAWRLNNEYNSPVNQMNRLKAAGLNPHLVSNSVSNTSSAPSVPPGQRVQLGPQMDFVGNFLRIAEVMSDLNIKLSDAELRKQSADDDHKVKEAQASNILQDTILKQINADKGRYEYNKWYPQITAKYQEEVSKLGNENYLLYLQGQRQKMENDMRKYYKEHYFMNDMEYDSMMKEYTAKSQKYRYVNFLPIEREMLGYNRDIRKKEFDYLSTYGTSSPGSGNFMGVPLSAVMSPELGVSALNTGKKLARTAAGFIKGLFEGDGHWNGFGNFNNWRFRDPSDPYFWSPWKRERRTVGGTW